MALKENGFSSNSWSFVLSSARPRPVFRPTFMAAALTFIQYPVVKDHTPIPVGSASPNRLSDPSCCRVPFKG
jgi:hypothetical protein